MQIIISNRVSYRLETARCLRKRSAFFLYDGQDAVNRCNRVQLFIHSFIYFAQSVQKQQ